MKLHKFVLLFVVLMLVYFDQTTKIEARRRSSHVQRGDKKLIRAGDFRLIKPKMNKRKLLLLVLSSLVVRELLVWTEPVNEFTN